MKHSAPVAHLVAVRARDRRQLGIEPERPQARAAAALLLEDERRFIDLAKSPIWWGEEKPIVG